MEQNAFIFNKKIFKQNFGTAMGNPLSPFLANLFMWKFERKIKQTFNNFPKVWFRYVDDVFAIVPKHFSVTNFLNHINSVTPSIKFTFEEEKEKKLPFLDLLIIINNNKIEFDIFRKNTHTDNYIHNSSICPKNHKFAVFHSLFYRLFNVPLTNERFKIEFDYILKIASNNEFDKTTILKIFKKHERKHLRKISTTLTIDKKQPNKRAKFIFVPHLHYQFKNLFKKLDIELVFNNPFNIKFLLGNTFEKPDDKDRSGIYSIECDNCEKLYIGQTKRKLITRFKEHVNYVKNNNIDKSALALHFHETGHTFNIDNLKLLRGSNHWNLNMLESIEMYKHKNKLLNFDLSPLNNSLLKFIKTEK